MVLQQLAKLWESLGSSCNAHRLCSATAFHSPANGWQLRGFRLVDTSCDKSTARARICRIVTKRTPSQPMRKCHRRSPGGVQWHLAIRGGDAIFENFGLQDLFGHVMSRFEMKPVGERARGDATLLESLMWPKPTCLFWGFVKNSALAESRHFFSNLSRIGSDIGNLSIRSNLM